MVLAALLIVLHCIAVRMACVVAEGKIELWMSHLKLALSDLMQINASTITRSSRRALSAATRTRREN